MQKTPPRYYLEHMFTAPLPSNGRLIVARVGSSGNVFTESLPSNVSIRHNSNNDVDNFSGDEALLLLPHFMINL
jgi:hypothetical protein